LTSLSSAPVLPSCTLLHDCQGHTTL
jgi:hypothetical protein